MAIGIHITDIISEYPSLLVTISSGEIRMEPETFRQFVSCCACITDDPDEIVDGQNVYGFKTIVIPQNSMSASDDSTFTPVLFGSPIYICADEIQGSNFSLQDLLVLRTPNILSGYGQNSHTISNLTIKQMQHSTHPLSGSDIISINSLTLSNSRVSIKSLWTNQSNVQDIDSSTGYFDTTQSSPFKPALPGSVYIFFLRETLNGTGINLYDVLHDNPIIDIDPSTGEPLPITQGNLVNSDGVTCGTVTYNTGYSISNPSYVVVSGTTKLYYEYDSVAPAPSYMFSSNSEFSPSSIYVQFDSGRVYPSGSNPFFTNSTYTSCNIGFGNLQYQDTYWGFKNLSNCSVYGNIGEDGQTQFQPGFELDNCINCSIGIPSTSQNNILLKSCSGHIIFDKTGIPNQHDLWLDDNVQAEPRSDHYEIKRQSGGETVVVGYADLLTSSSMSNKYELFNIGFLPGTII